MRVISGLYKGRNIEGFDIDGTRPTMDRVKESLFSSIQNYIPDSVCLDLFSGSGNLGFEAISNGAKEVYFNDKNFKCTSLIKSYIKEFDISDSSIVTNMDYKKALEYYKDNNIKFDVVFLDPPYKFNELDKIVEYMHDNNMLNKDGIIILESSNIYFKFDFYSLIKEKKYGDKYISIYKNNL